MNDYIQIPIEIAKNLLALIPPMRRLKEKLSAKRDKILSNLDRPFQICQDFLRQMKQSREKINFRGKIILEVGPGNSFGTGLVFLALGARKIYLVDRFKHIFWDSKDIAFHKRLLSELANRNYPCQQVAKNAITIGNKGVKLNSDLIEYHFADASELPLEDKSIDFVFSNAVLEHIHKPECAIREFARVTKIGGLNAHQIDLRDHFFQLMPLRLLRYPNTLWNFMTYYRPGYTNRLRFSEWKVFFNRYFKIESIRYTRVFNDKVRLHKIKLNKRFKKYTKNELCVLAFWILLSK